MSDWKPTAFPSRLTERADLLRSIREFFYRRGVLEVETPILGAGAATDRHLGSLETRLGRSQRAEGRRLYLQTSPEFAMKRLLAAGSGAIYQIGKAFRDDESGRHHNPEFTLLEWYRVGWDHQALMNEIDELLSEILDEPPAERLTYAELFQRHLSIDPHTVTGQELGTALDRVGIKLSDDQELDRDTRLQVLMSEAIEPQLPRDRPTFVFDYPSTQAALARLRPGASGHGHVAERFEVFVRGIELANGYHELRDPDEQEKRFQEDLASRRQNGLPEVATDHRLLAALRAGLPHCAGVALGVDRLVMLATGAKHIDEVLAFPIDRA